MTSITAKVNQGPSSNNHQILNDVKKRKLENVIQKIRHQSLREVKKRKLEVVIQRVLSIATNSTESGGQNFAKLCKKTAINDEHLQPPSDVVVKGLNFKFCCKMFRYYNTFITIRKRGLNKYRSGDDNQRFFN